MQYNQHYANNKNDYFIDVTNLGLHNKDFALVTQASILVIYIYSAKIEHKTLCGSRVHSHNIPLCNCVITAATKATKVKAKATTIDNKKRQQSAVLSQQEIGTVHKLVEKIQTAGFYLTIGGKLKRRRKEEFCNL